RRVRGTIRMRGAIRPRPRRSRRSEAVRGGGRILALVRPAESRLARLPTIRPYERACHGGATGGPVFPRDRTRRERDAWSASADGFAEQREPVATGCAAPGGKNRNARSIRLASGSAAYLDH